MVELEFSQHNVSTAITPKAGRGFDHALPEKHPHPSDLEKVTTREANRPSHDPREVLARDYTLPHPPTLHRTQSAPLPAKGGPLTIDPAVWKPAVTLKPPPSWSRCFVNTVRYSWLNVLLVFIPVSWALHFSGQGDTVVFVTSALAIIPLAALLSFATEEVAMRLGSASGGLLNASFGNAIELIIAILALTKGEIRLVQSAMIGSILSNSLLVLGVSALALTVYWAEVYNTSAASSLVVFATTINLTRSAARR